MRRNFAFLLGTATGACLAVLVMGPQGAHLVAAAKAAARPDAYTQLNLFGNVFERIKASYIEKPDDNKLMEGAINGMISSLDPHSRYMNEKGFAWKDAPTPLTLTGTGFVATPKVYLRDGTGTITQLQHVAFVSTSKGVVTDREARKQKVGGEVLAYVW